MEKRTTRVKKPTFIVGGPTFVADGTTRDINGYPLRDGQIDLNAVAKEALKYQRQVGARATNATPKKKARK